MIRFVLSRKIVVKELKLLLSGIAQFLGREMSSTGHKKFDFCAEPDYHYEQVQKGKDTVFIFS